MTKIDVDAIKAHYHRVWAEQNKRISDKEYRRWSQSRVAQALERGDVGGAPADAAPVEAAEPTADLPEGHLACADCGQATTVPEGAPVAERHVLRREWVKDERDPGGHRIATTSELLLARCEPCADRQALADRLLAAAPGVRKRRGPVVREHLVENLCALEAAGATTAHGMGAVELLRAFEAVRPADGSTYRAAARAVRWALYDRPRDLIGKCAPRPWAHVSEEVRGALREVSARLLSVRVASSAPPVDLAPPTGSGCLLCGVSAVRMSAADVVRRGGPEEARAAVWTDRTSKRLEGSLCGPCEDASGRELGTLGPSAAERAYAEHVRRSDPARSGVLWSRIRLYELAVRPWCEANAAPSDRPWAHVPSE
ncbi:hypothetical protein [Nocardiopsis quinghaiensis]|uniref:hypothetical protein n=1 Tax=Nocardiopsis quinghaiensis TaxID=464995 RepID=UPI0012393ED6|nr:hypothetical protein [Nocardiopsis quinghaiensis]